MRNYLIIFILISCSFSNKIEKLFYEVYFNDIKAGASTLMLSQHTDNHKYIIDVNLKSKKIIDFIYKLRESSSIVVDKNNYSIYKIEKKYRHGRRKKEYNGSFNYNTKTGLFNNLEIVFSTTIHDPISIIYYLRSKVLTQNSVFTFDIISKNKLKTIEMGVLDEEKIIIQNKEYDCFIIGPKDNKLTNADDIKIWISKTNPQLPVVIEKKAKLGIIKMQLENIETYD